MPSQPDEMVKSLLEPSSVNSSQPSTNKPISSFDQAEPLPPLSDRANDLIGKFQSLTLSNSQPVETAFIAPICAPGDCIIFSGPAGVGKSGMGGDLILGAAHPDRQGRTLGGLFRFSIPSGQTIKCACLDAESSKVRFESGLHRKMEKEGLAPDGLGCVRYISASDCGLDNVNQRKQNSQALAEALAHDRVQFVIIDTIANAWAPPNINDPEWVFSGLKVFREFCQKFGITIVAFTHPNRKAGQETRSFNPMGTSQQENQADTQISVTRILGKRPDGIQLCLRKSRRAFWINQGSIVSLRFTPEYGYEPLGDWEKTWPHEWDGDSGLSDLANQSTIFKVESVLKGASPEGLSAQAIATKINCSDRTVRSNLNKLEKGNLAARVGRGPSTTWRFGL